MYCKLFQVIFDYIDSYSMDMGNKHFIPVQQHLEYWLMNSWSCVHIKHNYLKCWRILFQQYHIWFNGQGYSVISVLFYIMVSNELIMSNDTCKNYVYVYSTSTMLCLVKVSEVLLILGMLTLWHDVVNINTLITCYRLQENCVIHILSLSQKYHF